MENSKASFSIVGYSWKAAKGELKCWCPCRVSNSQSKLSGWTQLAYAEKKANPYIWQSQGAAASFEIDTCTKTELGQDLLTFLSSPAQRTADPLDSHKMAHLEYKMAFREAATHFHNDRDADKEKAVKQTEEFVIKIYSWDEQDSHCIL